MSQEADRATVERRREPRLQTAAWLGAQVALLLDSQIIDLSARGMQAELDFCPEAGSSYDFLLLFEDRALKVRGIVRNVRALTDSLHAVGVEFEGLSAEDGAFLESLVQKESEAGD